MLRDETRNRRTMSDLLIEYVTIWPSLALALAMVVPVGVVFGRFGFLKFLNGPREFFHFLLDETLRKRNTPE